MNFRSIRIILPVVALAASGGLLATESTTAGVDPCVVYPYYGETSTRVPDPTESFGGSSETAANQVVVNEWGVQETPEDLERVLSALRHGQYLGL